MDDDLTRELFKMMSRPTNYSDIARKIFTVEDLANEAKPSTSEPKPLKGDWNPFQDMGQET